MAQKRPAHPNDVALAELAEHEHETDSPAGLHVGSCASCAARVAELRSTRMLLHAIADDEVRPPHDLAHTVIGRLRRRQSAIGNVNEVFSAIRALMRGLSEMFGGKASRG